MKKSCRKLFLHRETVLRLDELAKTTAGGPLLLSDETPETYPVDALTAFPCDILVNTKTW
jgi:hypothetical protein